MPFLPFIPRVADRQLFRTLFCAAVFFAANSDKDLARSTHHETCTLVISRDSMACNDVDHALGIEVLRGQTEVVNSNFRIGTATSQHQTLRAIANTERRHRSLPGLNRHPKQALVKVERPFDVGDGYRGVIQRHHGDGRWTSLSRQPGRRGQCRNREEETPSA